jgi:lipoprotein-anchoring transpeptidase ErfK/SrfK
VSYRRYRSRPVLSRVLALAALCAAALVAAAAVARAEGPPAETTPQAGPALVAEGVTVAGVSVGGLSADEAEAAAEEAFRERITLTFRSQTWTVAPRRLGAKADVAGAVVQALASLPGTPVGLPVTVDRERLRAYTRRVAGRYSRPTVNSTVELRGLRPYVARARKGLDIRQGALFRALRSALVTHERGVIDVAYERRLPRVTRSNFGPVVVIRRGSKRLYLYEGGRYRQDFGVATGQASYPTPLGRFTIVTKQRNPWWYPPSSDWARGLEPVPPGPGNPLGTRWMGLSARSIGIHGTPDAASIGYSASHGCIRLRIRDAEWLFERVRVGTPVFVVSA